MDLKRVIQENAAEIVKLHARVHETYSQQTKSRDLRAPWKAACEEFRQRYNLLAFPGGYDTAGPRILAGDELAVEAALCFLEIRPYFFRSGYMYKVLLRRIKRVELSPVQATRLRSIIERQTRWRRTKVARTSPNKPLKLSVGRGRPPAA
jgi:hypothetical protein